MRGHYILVSSLCRCRARPAVRAADDPVLLEADGGDGVLEVVAVKVVLVVVVDLVVRVAVAVAAAGARTAVVVAAVAAAAAVVAAV